MNIHLNTTHDCDLFLGSRYRLDLKEITHDKHTVICCISKYIFLLIFRPTDSLKCCTVWNHNILQNQIALVGHVNWSVGYLFENICVHWQSFLRNHGEKLLAYLTTSYLPWPPWINHFYLCCLAQGGYGKYIIRYLWVITVTVADVFAI